MKCINATWELRNLGVQTIEIEIEKNDAPEKILNNIENYRLQYDAKYVVIKSNTCYPIKISLNLQDAGFWLIENQIGLRLSRNDAVKTLEEYKDFIENLSYRLADESDLRLIFSELDKGIFKTDRVALDSHFDLKIANRRYGFWMKDAIKKGACIFLAIYENKPIGFFMGKSLDGANSDGLLGGIFNDKESSLLGSMCFLSGIKCFVDFGGVVEKTFVSSNNLDVLRLHLALGRKITSIRNVFVKHYD